MDLDIDWLMGFSASIFEAIPFAYVLRPCSNIDYPAS